MPYQELIQRLFNVNFFGGVKLGLQNVQKMQEALGYPDRAFRSIHIAGTNGKGSVSTKIAHAFEEEGHRVGLYTSPHISSFRERIRINSEMITEAAVETLLTKLFTLVKELNIPATFFELTTFLAFCYFAEQKVEIAVIETGLGGRLDATNIIHPILSIITSISLDHTEVLGSTLDAIATEKGGIIKEKVDVIIGPTVPFQPIKAIALQKQSRCIQVQEKSFLFEEENRFTARSALNYLAADFGFSDLSIERGLEMKQNCRFEICPRHSNVILDVAHNVDGLQHLFYAIKHAYPTKSLRLLFGLSKNKDLNGCIKILASNGSHFHLVEAKNSRAASTQCLKNILHDFSIDSSRIHAHTTIAIAVQEALDMANKNKELLVICGTFFIMSDARKVLGYDDPFDIIYIDK